MKPSDAIMVLKKHNDNKRGYPVEIPDIRVLVEAIDTVVAELEKPRYSAKDMESFHSWANDNGWSYGELTELWYNDEEEIEGSTIEDVVKLWKESTE